MKKGDTNRCLPDFWMTIYQETKTKEGEDSYCRCFCKDAGLLSVFDGCGGLGAQRHKHYSNATEAYIASRLCSGAFFDAFRKTFPLDDENSITGAGFSALAAAYCADVLSAYKPDVDTAARMRGTMVKALPTTAAAALIRCMKSYYAINPIWAGDSRVYLLTEAGLAQLTVDDTTVPDPMKNLYEDGILKNILCADKEPHLHCNEVHINEPFIVFAATDGCFGYFSTPMEFEGAILRTLADSSCVSDWEQRLHSCIGAIAGDDYTLGMASYGFGTFTRLKRTFKRRLELLQREYLQQILNLPLEDRDARQVLWQRYMPNYFRYIEDDT